MKSIAKVTVLILIPVLLCVGCTTTHYERVEGDTRTKVHHYSLGMDREGIDLNLHRKPDELNASVKVGSSSGSKSFDKAADSLIEAGKLMKTLKP